MRFLRSFPWDIPPGRNYVVDGMNRHYMRNYDYSGLASYEDDIFLVEWDIVITPEIVYGMEAWVKDYSERVQVVPYFLYPGPNNNLTKTVYAHRRILEPIKNTPPDTRHISFLDPRADYVGFGCIYLPQKILETFESADPTTRGVIAEGQHDTRFTNETFSYWLRHNQNEFENQAIVHWDYEPIHLNFPHWEEP